MTGIRGIIIINVKVRSYTFVPYLGTTYLCTHAHKDRHTCRSDPQLPAPSQDTCTLFSYRMLRPDFLHIKDLLKSHQLLS